MEFVPACLGFGVLKLSQERMVPLIRDLPTFLVCCFEQIYAPKITAKNRDPEVPGSFPKGFNAMPYKRGSPSTVPFLASVSWSGCQLRHVCQSSFASEICAQLFPNRWVTFYSHVVPRQANYVGLKDRAVIHVV